MCLELLFFLFLLLLLDVGIAGLVVYPRFTNFFWLIGDWSPYFVLDYPFFLDFDFLLTDFPWNLLLLSFFFLCESVIILNFCFTECWSLCYWELLIFGFDLFKLSCNDGLWDCRLVSVNLTELLWFCEL